jgi:hypothetical protein
MICLLRDQIVFVKKAAECDLTHRFRFFNGEHWSCKAAHAQSKRAAPFPNARGLSGPLCTLHLLTSCAKVQFGVLIGPWIRLFVEANHFGALVARARGRKPRRSYETTFLPGRVTP